MQTVKVDFGEIVGKIKPMNAVNNGPAGSRVRKTGNFQTYTNARFPYARLHDSSFYTGYGGEWSVDVHRIFRNFDADVNDESAYVFEPTDNYLQNIISAGTKPFYRLGAAIEHGYKYGTFPPKDYLKWAQICEHIIRHYNEGWANGFSMDIEYWEIWNEADCTDGDGTNPCWQGTRAEFVDFYCVVSKYLKEKFPKLKIGGPSVAWIGTGLMDDLLPAVKERGAGLDFFSFHRYAKQLEEFSGDILKVRARLDEFGFTDTEIILNEWNYIKGWSGDEWRYSLAMEKGLKGSAFALGAMCAGQALPLDMLMYYDARPCGMNGLFDTDTLRPLKTYYAYKAFADLKDLGDSVRVQTDGENIYAVAGTNGEESAILLTAYKDDDSAPTKDICIEVSGAKKGDCIKAEYYVLNENSDMELVKEEFFTADKWHIRLRIANYTSYYIKFVKA